MSVLIKGMEMPKNCGECLLAKLSPTGESLICNYMLSRVSWEERPFDCPLVPVREHGRLIDADELEHDFREDAKDAWNKEASPISWADAFDELADMVADAPTIIPAEQAEDGET